MEVEGLRKDYTAFGIVVVWIVKDDEVNDSDRFPIPICKIQSRKVFGLFLYHLQYPKLFHVRAKFETIMLN